MEIKKESHMQSIIEKEGELYENTKLWVSFDSVITEINELKGLIKSYKASSENWKKKYNQVKKRLEKSITLV